MVEVWIRQRNQLTVPVDIAAQAGLSPGSLCHMEFANGVITLTPADSTAGRPLESFAGIARGTWGQTRAHVESAALSDRDSWDR